MDRRVKPGDDNFGLIIQEAPQLPAPRWMLQLPQRLRVDLSDALSRDRELLADFFQRVVGVHADAEAHAQHAFLAQSQRGQHAGGGLARVRPDRRIDRQDRVLVLDETAEVRILSGNFPLGGDFGQAMRLLRRLDNSAFRRKLRNGALRLRCDGLRFGPRCTGRPNTHEHRTCRRESRCIYRSRV